MQELVRSVREVRNRYNVDPKTSLDIAVRSGRAVSGDFAALAPFIRTLAGVGTMVCGPDTNRPRQSAAHVTSDFEVYTCLAGLIDVEAEKNRLGKQREEMVKRLQADPAWAVEILTPEDRPASSGLHISMVQVTRAKT